MSLLIAAAVLLAVLATARIGVEFCIFKPALELGTAATIGNREIQADQFDYAQTDFGFMMAIADGIGSGEKGKIAAAVAVDACRTVFEQNSYFDNPGYFFQKAFQTANHDILEIIDDGTAGSNLLCAVVSAGKLYYALAGSCILAVYRSGDLVPLSEGHTIDMLANQSFRKGRISRQDALVAMKEHRVYNYVGQDGFHKIEYYDEPVLLKKGDIVVLMTDGVREHYGFGELEKLLRSKMSCEKLAFTVTDAVAALQIQGEKDNATLMLLRVNKPV